MQDLKNELELVYNVKELNCSDSLKTLFEKYKPMVDKIIANYHIRHFDRSDWYQEAYIVCHETCFKYDGSQGSKFGNFYQLRFNNHVKSLLRKELAIKRKLNKESSSFEYEKELGRLTGEFICGKSMQVNAQMEQDVRPFIDELSDRELAAFEMLMAIKPIGMVCKELNCSEKQVLNAADRCKQKLILFLQR